MRKLVTAAFVSLDGVMQAPGGPQEDPTGGFTLGGWTVNYWDESMGGFMDGIFTDPFALVLGRKTYEIFAAHWPFVGKDDPIGKAFNAATKYVATTSAEPLTWENTVALRGDAAAEIARLKQEDGPDLLTQGSSGLLQTLLVHDLIDELRLLTFPLILGPGKRLFGKGTKPAALKLTASSVSTTGVIMSVYQRAGKVDTGSFAMAEPSQAELARRERMKREG
ncbi:dihydrofolate reductase family protein [Rhizobium laguerreae]|uniref:dihydrofolate reductase family protein n=1 Tax=Rhizobium laguerreae TaxID=1076926 RepID=UPI00143F16C0|nr:dihydrofolate reductase family protein [Rhizobium laguerreae]MBN9981975.1 dihydrofolate reductase family protein [Rhizobium laguerreae]MBY3069262.1 dihydrofolate reductase family protein [Rhizobium laguerreae]MBY3089496.1 dihydrofolate reductase family protein [Rhizobium laguerreae]MBY3098690.1 dihydrofolate reductase family protein [Rhizobium laguerreae]MBY3105980.1 dihydrofolate reductase family protein [Rhizobium laguerreae]